MDLLSIISVFGLIGCVAMNAYIRHLYGHGNKGRSKKQFCLLVIGMIILGTMSLIVAILG